MFIAFDCILMFFNSNNSNRNSNNEFIIWQAIY